MNNQYPITVTNIELNLIEYSWSHRRPINILFSFFFITSEKEGSCMPSMATLIKSVTDFVIWLINLIPPPKILKWLINMTYKSCPHMHWKTLKSPHRKTKSSDNSNMLHMFNNKTNIDFGAPSKYILIPSYDIQVN